MKESKVKNENYIVIQGFMLNDLHLKGNELIVYACIYGFAQAENQAFTGSLQYLADWTNSTKQGVMNCLQSLQEKGLIVKRENYINNVKFCEYSLPVVKKVEYPIKESLIGGGKKSLLNNIDINNKAKNIEDIIKEVEDEQLRQTVAEFVKMRKSIKKPLTAYGLELTLKNLNKLSANIDEQVSILEQSITNCWQGVFALKENKKELKQDKEVGFALLNDYIKGETR